MTISTETNKIVYAGLTGQDVFAYNFKVVQKSDMNVLFDAVLQPEGDWTIDGLGDAAGGNVTLNTPLASDQSVTLLREVDQTQEVDYQPFDAFPAETHEGALDKLTMNTQQLQEQADRSIKASVDTPTGVDYTLPAPDAGKGLIWNQTSDGLINSDDEINGITAAAQASADASAVSAGESAASAAAALDSENAAAASAATAAAESAAAFDAKLAGYVSDGLHTEFTGDLDTILINSKYYIQSSVVDNEPAGFTGIGVIETDMWVTDPTQAVQVLTSMDDANSGAAWIRNLEASSWSAWLPFGAGGVTILDTPPANPAVGQIWWSDVSGRSYVYYDDGDSVQWVEEVPPAAVTEAGLVSYDNTVSGLTAADVKAALDEVVVGSYVQSQISEYATYIELTTTFPVNDNVPTTSQGNGLIAVAITPKYADSILEVELFWAGGVTTSGLMVICLFETAVSSNAIATAVSDIAQNGALLSMPLRHELSANAAGVERTFNFFCGNSVGSCWPNGNASSRLYGGTTKCWISVKERRPN